MNYKGIIIEESLINKEVLKKIQILTTKVEPVTEAEQTPWIKQWTMHTIEVAEPIAQEIANDISKSLDKEHNWYADFKNDNFHYIIFRNKIFKVNRNSREDYGEVTKYGISLGIPDYQLDFSPDIK